jgi:hypothetical protein
VVEAPLGSLEFTVVLDNNIKLGSDKVPLARDRSDLAKSGDLQLPVKGYQETGIGDRIVS